MKNFAKYIGIILVLAGVLAFAIPGFMHQTTNTTLLIGISLEVIGFILHIVLNRQSHEIK